MKFVSAGTFDMNESQGNQNNSKNKSLSDQNANAGSNPKTSAVNRFVSKKVIKKSNSQSKPNLKSNQSTKVKPNTTSQVKPKSQSQTPNEQ